VRVIRVLDTCGISHYILNNYSSKLFDKCYFVRIFDIKQTFIIVKLLPIWMNLLCLMWTVQRIINPQYLLNSFYVGNYNFDIRHMLFYQTVTNLSLGIRFRLNSLSRTNNHPNIEETLQNRVELNE